jgi:thiol-disulfide isomerase/thioredoxin
MAFTARAADETFPTLKVKDQVFTNVTVTSTTATDIYFSHRRGLASAKLKDLTPELQKHFHFDAVKGAEIETAQRDATANYKATLAGTKFPVPSRDTAAAVSDEGDFVAPQLHARSVRGQPTPQITIQSWITEPPDFKGKFLLIDFWATWCGPCRQSIPELNAFQARYGNRLTVIGISDESEEAIRKMTSPHIDYAVASDPGQRMLQTLQITGIPHCILIDPSGIVRYEGMPQYLDNQKLEYFLDKYSK